MIQIDDTHAARCSLLPDAFQGLKLALKCFFSPKATVNSSRKMGLWEPLGSGGVMIKKTAFALFVLPFSLGLTMTAAQAQQKFPGWITGCSAGPFGGENCPAEAAGALMASLPIGLLERDLPNANFDTFALEEVLRRMGSGVQSKAQRGGCNGADDVVVAGEILRAKIPANPSLSGDERELFDHLMNIATNASDYVGEGC
jgi:hypothetical protein